MRINLTFTVEDDVALTVAYCAAAKAGGVSPKDIETVALSFQAGDRAAAAKMLLECLADAVDWASFGVEAS